MKPHRMSAESRVGHMMLLLAASSLPFVPGLSKEFIFDDNPAILHNKVLMSNSVAPLFSTDYWGGNLSSRTSHKSYRPLTSLTFWLQTRNPMTPSIALEMKLVNIVINCLNSVCIYIIVGTILKLCRLKMHRPQHCLSISLMFAIHPVHVEPVLSIVGRADLLYALLFLAATLLALRQSGTKFFSISLLTACSMFCKEQGILFFLFFAVLQYSFFQKKPNIISSQSGRLFLYILANVMILAYVRLSLIKFSPPKFQQGDNPAAYQDNPVFKALSFMHIYACNAWILLCPNWLCFDWAMGCIPLIVDLDPRMAAIFIFVCMIVLMVVISIVEELEGQSFLLISFSLAVVPFLLCLSLVVRVGFVIAERNLYLSVLGYVLIYHYGLFKLARYLCRPRLIYCFHVVLLLVLLLQTVNRSVDWSTEMRLYVSGLKVCPNNAKIYYNIAKKFDHRAEFDSAKVFYREAVRIEPEFEHALNNLGNLLRGEGRYEEAEAMLRRTVEVNPGFAAAHMNLAIVYQHRGKFRESEREYLKALDLRNGDYPDCIFNLGNLYVKMQKLDEAELQYRKGLKTDHELSYVNLVILLNEIDRLPDAKIVSRQGVSRFPANSELRFQLANTLGKLEEYQAAEEEYLKALDLKERSSYYLNLGVLYHRWGKLKQAGEAYAATVRVEPTNKNAVRYLAQVKRMLSTSDDRS